MPAMPVSAGTTVNTWGGKRPVGSLQTHATRQQRPGGMAWAGPLLGLGANLPGAISGVYPPLSRSQTGRRKGRSRRRRRSHRSLALCTCQGSSKGVGGMP